MVRESNLGGGEIFRTCPDRPWSPPSLLYNEYRVFPGGKERPGCDADPSPRSSAVGHERVELYLYSPYGPYALYRASVYVQGCTLPFTYHKAVCKYVCTRVCVCACFCHPCTCIDKWGPRDARRTQEYASHVK